MPRPSSPLSAKASTRCPCFALDHRRLPSEDAAQPPRTGPRPPKGFHPARRPRMKTLLRIGATQVWLRRSASVTSQLSLFTLQSTPASQGLRGCSRLRQNAAAHPHGGGAHGGGERDRTDDLLLAKQALSQLSYTPVPEIGNHNTGRSAVADLRLLVSGWWAREDLNLRPHAYQARALTS